MPVKNEDFYFSFEAMTLYIVIFTTLISILALGNHKLMEQLIFNPYVTRVRNEWFRFFSCALLHADYIHLGVNMFVLYSFGQAVEYYYDYAFGSKGTLMFILLYVSSVIAANISTYMKHQHNPAYNSLGASGAVSAIVFTSILFNPFDKVYLYGFIGLPGIVIGVAYLIYSYYMSQRASGDNINHEAHFYGSIHGIVFTIAFKPEIGKRFLEQLF